MFDQERMGSLLLREGISIFALVKSKDHAETTPKANSQALSSEDRQHSNQVLLAFSQEVLHLLQPEIGSPVFPPH